jgi:ATP-dependent protease ClpP protease subunit
VSAIKQQALALLSRRRADLAPSAPAGFGEKLVDDAIALGKRCKAIQPNRTPLEQAAYVEMIGEHQSRIFQHKDLAVIHINHDLTWGSLDQYVKPILQSREVSIFINSTGGSIPDAAMLYDALQGRNVSVCVPQVCASAAILILCAGQKRRVLRGAKVMVHSAHSMAAGRPWELIKSGVALAWGSRKYRRILERHCSRRDVNTWLRSKHDIWLTDQDAFDSGLITEIMDPEPMPV